MTEDALKNLKSYNDERATELLTWLFNTYAGDSRKISAKLAIHSSVVSKIYSASYSASIDQFLDRVEALKVRHERTINDLFVEGETAKNIWEILNRARDTGSMALIQGASRRGKTAAIREWIARNQGGFYRASYIDVPADKSVRSLLREISKVTGNGREGSKYQLAERLGERLSNRDIIILDEAARLMRYNDPTEALEFIRRLHDQQGVSVVFCATNWFNSELKDGRYNVYLEQLLGRLEDRLEIPKNVSRAEVKAFLSPHTQGVPANDLIRLAQEVVRMPGKLAELSRHINDALLIARDMGEKHINFKYFETAVITRKSSGIWADPE